MSRRHGHYSDSANGPTYGQQLDAEQIQSLVDQRIKVLLGGAGSQHLDFCPQRPCLPAMLPTGMPTYGSQMPEAERILSLIDQRIKDHLGAAGSQQAIIPDATVKLNCNPTSRGGGGGDSMSSGGGGDSMVKNSTSCETPRSYSNFTAGGKGNTTSCETPRSYSNFTAGGKEEALYTELWHACAGPLVTVPREGERVFYFPQGHIEQQDEHAVEKEPLPPAPRMPHSHSHSIPVEQDETLKFREDSPGMTSSPSDLRRKLWPVPLRKFT